MHVQMACTPQDYYCNNIVIFYYFIVAVQKRDRWHTYMSEKAITHRRDSKTDRQKKEETQFLLFVGQLQRLTHTLSLSPSHPHSYT